MMLEKWESRVLFAEGRVPHSLLGPRPCWAWHLVLGCALTQDKRTWTSSRARLLASFRTGCVWETRTPPQITEWTLQLREVHRVNSQSPPSAASCLLVPNRAASMSDLTNCWTPACQLLWPLTNTVRPISLSSRLERKACLGLRLAEEISRESCGCQEGGTLFTRKAGI